MSEYYAKQLASTVKNNYFFVEQQAKYYFGKDLTRMEMLIIVKKACDLLLIEEMKQP